MKVIELRTFLRDLSSTLFYSHEALFLMIGRRKFREFIMFDEHKIYYRFIFNKYN